MDVEMGEDRLVRQATTGKKSSVEQEQALEDK